MVEQRERRDVQHGGYTRETRFQITQHDYAGVGFPGDDKYSGDGKYIEVLEVTDPPRNKRGVVLHECMHNPDGSFSSYFAEFDTVAEASEVFRLVIYSGYPLRLLRIPRRFGIKSRVNCEGKIPWFYAREGKLIKGNFAV